MNTKSMRIHANTDSIPYRYVVRIQNMNSNPRKQKITTKNYLREKDYNCKFQKFWSSKTWSWSGSDKASGEDPHLDEYGSQTRGSSILFIVLEIRTCGLQGPLSGLWLPWTSYHSRSSRRRSWRHAALRRSVASSTYIKNDTTSILYKMNWDFILYVPPE